MQKYEGQMIIMSADEYDALEKWANANQNHSKEQIGLIPLSPYLFKQGDKVGYHIQEVDSNGEKGRQGWTVYGTITSISPCRSTANVTNEDEQEVRINTSQLFLLERPAPKVNYDAITASNWNLGNNHYMISWHFGDFLFDIVSIFRYEDGKIDVKGNGLTFEQKFDYILNNEIKEKGIVSFQYAIHYCRKRIAEIIFESITETI